MRPATARRSTRRRPARGFPQHAAPTRGCAWRAAALLGRTTRCLSCAARGPGAPSPTGVAREAGEQVLPADQRGDARAIGRGPVLWRVEAGLQGGVHRRHEPRGPGNVALQRQVFGKGHETPLAIRLAQRVPAGGQDEVRSVVRLAHAQRQLAGGRARGELLGLRSTDDERYANTTCEFGKAVRQFVRLQRVGHRRLGPDDDRGVRSGRLERERLESPPIQRALFWCAARIETGMMGSDRREHDRPARFRCGECGRSTLKAAGRTRRTLQKTRAHGALRSVPPAPRSPSRRRK